MPQNNNSAPQQPNVYQLTNLMNDLQPLMHDLSIHQRQIGSEILSEFCSARNSQEVTILWEQECRHPIVQSKPMTIIHYNIRHFYANQVDLVDLIDQHSPSIVSINELGTLIPKRTIQRLLFSYNIFLKEGTNPHGGAVLAIDKKLSCEQIETNLPNMIAVRTGIKEQQYVVASIYSPPTEDLPLAAMTKLIDNEKKVIIAGDLNAKHPDWGCPQTNTKGRRLAEWLSTRKMKVLNHGINTSLRSTTTIDLIISNEPPGTTESTSLSYNGSDHLPILTKFFNVYLSNDRQVIPRTNWKLYPLILSVLFHQLKIDQEESIKTPEGTHQWFIEFEQFLAALKRRLTEWKEVGRRRPSISPSMRILLRHKHYLQNRYRHSKLEEDRIRLRSWSTLVKHEFQSLRQRTWEQFLSNVTSPNPNLFWKTVNQLNKKKPADFSALREGDIIHRSSSNIVSCLTRHFIERHAPPPLNLVNPVDKQADTLWNQLKSPNDELLETMSKETDLQFELKEVEKTIQALKNKKSTGFDRVSNQMVKLLPAHYHGLLTKAYNKLFQNVHWGNEWKSARTICLNKVDNPAPSTNQLRPISMLPTFSKIYEKLFLARFNQWTNRMNILPWQQSGARSHQAITSRVNCLVEQITQSLRHSSFIPVVYIDFLQAFDKLWIQGLLLKLKKLDCPTAYLLWLTNYFTGRTLKIDHGGTESLSINVHRGAPQGSCIGPIMYVIAHHDLLQCLQDPTHAHAYIDDIAIAYVPSIHLKRIHQIEEIEKRINTDMLSLSKYSAEWHQPLNPQKTEMVVYRHSAQCPQLKVSYDGTRIKQTKCFKYLGFHLDSRLSFQTMIDAQLTKSRKAYQILKHIHRQFPSHVKLKMKFFNTYIWPHLYLTSTIYCMLSQTGQKRLASFYRRCLRMIHLLFQCPSEELHNHFNLPTIEKRFKSSLQKRLKNIQLHEHSLIECSLQAKYQFNVLHQHYRTKPFLNMMPQGRPNKRLVSLLDSDTLTFFDRLCNLVLG